jgi:hypothetical protein
MSKKIITLLALALFMAVTTYIAYNSLNELENFDFDAKFTVNSFEYTYVPKNGDPREGRVTGDRFSNEWTSAVNACKPNDVFMIEKVKVTGPDGSMRTITGVSVQIKM